ncbi:hypothetical protein VTK73DRAFT_10281 [Phialemonium thermophilum]|uniref:Exosome complex protein n=1 Tax=Phialemonium thermophilum TaxID=223376 RepID=A0ABR3XHL7_9PEZI
MDVTDITPKLDQLKIDLDKLEKELKPLKDIGAISSKLPLLDKAKLYVTVAYALESLLFSSLRLNGVDTKEHPIYTELTRVKQYFEKIKKIETPEPERQNTLDTQAAIRFIRSDVADNKELKEKLAEQLAKEKAKAALKASKAAKKRRAEDGDSSESAAPGKEDNGAASSKKAKKSSKGR